MYSPDRDTLHGAGCPNSSQVQQLGGSVNCTVLDFGGFRKVLGQNGSGVRVILLPVQDT